MYFAAALLLALPAWGAPPELTGVYPAGAAIGQTTTVTLTGTFPTWPVKVVADTPAIGVKPEKEKGQLTLFIAPDAAPGMHFLRVADPTGVSAPKPIFLDPAPVTLEHEPNDALKQAAALGAGGTVYGKLGKAGDVDVFAIQAEAGKWIVAELYGNNFLESPMDAVLQLCTENGFVVAQNHDGSGLDPQLAWKVERSGTYYLRLFAFPSVANSTIAFAGGETFAYRLSATTGPFAVATSPLAVPLQGEQQLTLLGWNLEGSAAQAVVKTPASSAPARFWWTPPAPVRGQIPLVAFAGAVLSEPASPDRTPVPIPSCITGGLSQPKERDRYYFRAAKGDKLLLTAESAALGFDCDLAFRLLDEKEAVLFEADDMGKNRDPLLNFTAPAEGLFALELYDVNDGAGPRHLYRLTLESPRPKLELTVAAGLFAVKKGTPLEVTVTIGRLQGFSTAVEIVADGLPPGFSAEAVTSEPKGDSAKTVKLKLTAESGAAPGSFRIIAREKDKPEPLAVAIWTQTLGGVSVNHTELWTAAEE